MYTNLPSGKLPYLVIFGTFGTQFSPSDLNDKCVWKLYMLGVFSVLGVLGVLSENQP